VDERSKTNRPAMPGAQIVEHYGLMPCFGKCLTGMGTDKASAARNENFQGELSDDET